MRIFVELAGGLDVAQWAGKYAAGVAPDPVPYGLHHLARPDDVVRFRKPLLFPSARTVSSRVEAKLWGWEFAREAFGLTDHARRTADVVLCMDERTGGPAALAAGPPVVTGVGWLERASELPPVQRRLAVRALDRSAAVFTQCEALVRPLIDEFRLDASKVHAVRMGIDAEHFAPAPWPTGSPVVFSVGDDRMRDHDMLVQAMEIVRRRNSDARLHLATTLRVDVPDDLGRVTRRRMDHEVRGCYAEASVVAVALKPTRQGSGLTVALEAMASGRPIVITANPGLERYVEHGVTGLLVPPGDPDAMASAIGELLADPDRAEHMGRAARQRLETSFTSAHMADDIRAVLDRAV